MAFRKLELIPLLFIIGSTLLLCGLGGWQLKRLAWKENLLTQIETAQNLSPLQWPPHENFKESEYRSIKMLGRFLHDKELHKTSKYRSKQVGYHILTPFQPAMHVAFNPKTGKPFIEQTTLLVNRGWVPANMKNREKRPDTVKEEFVTITGLLVPPQKKNPFLPPNNVEKNLWLYDDLKAMSKAAGHTLHPLMVVITGDTKTATLPIPSDGKIRMRNDHLGYAITWFSLALIGLIMFGIYYREPTNPR